MVMVGQVQSGHDAGSAAQRGLKLKALASFAFCVLCNGPGDVRRRFHTLDPKR